MGQKASTVRQFTPDAKPPKRENDFSLEKSKNENEENVINARESLKAIQKRLGVNVIRKESKMLMEMETFIIDTIVVEKLKHPGNFNEIATAIKQKLDGQYGGYWNVIIVKDWNFAESGYAISIYDSIQLTYESNYYSVFRSK